MLRFAAKIVEETEKSCLRDFPGETHEGADFLPSMILTT